MYEKLPGRLRRFCSTCGSHVVDELPAFSNVVVVLATLDRSADPDSRHEWTLHPVR
jgi:ADP-ribosyl-[dinitrogen reductase] hydrolase